MIFIFMYMSVITFLATVIGNVGTIIAFRLGQEDTHGMTPIFNPHFNYLDIIGLPDWQGYARLQIGGDTVSPFQLQDTERPNLVQ